MAEPELKGPIKGSRFIHHAILTEAQYFQEAATALVVDDEKGAADLNERLAGFERVLKTHEDSEDLTIFPALQAKFSYIADTYEFDHRRHRTHAGALVSTLAELGNARGGRRSELVKLLGDQAVVFNAFMILHIDKENELLFPAYDGMFSVEEQLAHGQAAQGHIPPEAMATASVWMFQRLAAADREGFLRQMMGMLPPAAVAGSPRAWRGLFPLRIGRRWSAASPS